MHFSLIQLEHFRNFAKAEFIPSKSLNIFFGDNGAGKSSILEAIHLLGFGRSFRTTKQDSVISFGSSHYTVFGQLNDGGEKDRKVGLSRSKVSGFEFGLDGERSKRISDIAKLVPVQIFTPQSSDLIIGPPLLRRRFIDWGLFHVEHSFSLLASKYVKILAQRNALLKLSGKKDYTEIEYWENQLAVRGETITKLRSSYVNELNSKVSAIYHDFLPEFNLELRYNRGWEKESSLIDSIQRKRERDSIFGSTSVGPHKGELRILCNGVLASEMLSRGQLRLLVAVLQISQVQLLSSKVGKTTVFLIDDIAAELDIKTREFFLDLILSMNTQVFVTAIEARQTDFAKKYNDKKMFHVEHNQVKEEL